MLEVVHGRASAIQRELLAGNVGSIERYKYVSGRLSGINEVLHIRSEVSGLIESERKRRSEADRQ